MIRPKIVAFLSGLTFMLLFCSPAQSQSDTLTLNQVQGYKPDSKELYDAIVHMDSVWEDSYNHCRVDVQEEIISEDLEFYHDRTGLMKSKKDLIQALKNNICGKVTRELLKGSIEVYPINNYGAVEMGYHRFHSKNDTGQPLWGRFIHLWRNENGHWKITRVISLHA